MNKALNLKWWMGWLWISFKLVVASAFKYRSVWRCAEHRGSNLKSCLLAMGCALKAEVVCSSIKLHTEARQVLFFTNGFAIINKISFVLSCCVNLSFQHPWCLTSSAMQTIDCYIWSIVFHSTLKSDLRVALKQIITAFASQGAGSQGFSTINSGLYRVYRVHGHWRSPKTFSSG